MHHACFVYHKLISSIWNKLIVKPNQIRTLKAIDFANFRRSTNICICFEDLWWFVCSRNALSHNFKSLVSLISFHNHLINTFIVDWLMFYQVVACCSMLVSYINFRLLNVQSLIVWLKETMSILYTATSCVYFLNIVTQLSFVQCQLHHGTLFPQSGVH